MRSASRRARRRRTRTHRASSPASDHPHPDSSTELTGRTDRPASGSYAAPRVGEGLA
ncbi:hypothetical protein [Actinomyces sp. ZJ308]|uniref:hypothetical protein n=1 Tax=Actinomyces sp. ZJ308 TaxID=2708342 RepID=UPI0014249C22|nr:hypothetical protein [Actinomyces sp. ZJ308]